MGTMSDISHLDPSGRITVEIRGWRVMLASAWVMFLIWLALNIWGYE